MKYHITKTYSEGISRNYDTQKFTTTLSKDVEVATADELVAESKKLFLQAKMLTELDMKENLKL